jgi:hypothetical protein
MPTLKDYLGALVKDLNYARAIADVESANIAKMYAEHDLLKHFSIPRMKIQDTELTIPVAVSELETSTEAEYQPIDNTKFYAATYGEIKNTLKAASFNRPVSAVLKKEIFAHIADLEKTIRGGGDIAASLASYCDAISQVSVRSVKEDDEERAAFDSLLKQERLSEAQLREKLAESLQTFLRPGIQPRELKSRIENSRVVVESSKLREERPENLVYIKMKITEESMEWQTMEDSEGNIVSKLTVE